MKKKLTKMRQLQLLLVAGFCVFLVYCYLMFPKDASLSEQLCWDHAPQVIVRVAPHTYAFAWEDKPFIQNQQGEMINACYKPGDPPLEGSQVMVRAEALHQQYDNDALFEKTRRGFTLRVFIRKMAAPVRAQDDYTRYIIPRVGTNYQKMLPQKDGYYLLEEKKERHVADIFYIATENKFVTPSGNPIVFRCHLGKAGGECGGTIALDEDTELSFDLLSGLYVPRTKLKSFYYDLLRYIDKTEIE